MPLLPARSRPMASRFCLQPHCPEVVEAKSGWCAKHDPWEERPAWSGSASSEHRSSGWEWGRLRRRALRRDSYLCRKCGSPATEVDHIVPVAECVRQRVNADDMANLQSLCTSCHWEKTEIDRLRGMRRRRERRGRNGYEDDEA